MTELTDALDPLYRRYHKNQHELVDPAFVDDRTESRGWETGGYKTYERFDAVDPPAGFDPDADPFLAELRGRESVADPTAARPVTREELFTVLSCAYGVGPDGQTRPVASAGQLYPLEIYPLVLDSPDLDAGLYHYNPAENVLERPAAPEYVSERFGPLEAFVAEHWTHLGPENEVSVMLLLSAVPARSVAKYGERGYLFTLVEAGEVIHATQLAAGRLGVGSRPYAGFRYDAVDGLLGLESASDEWTLASVALAGTA